MGTANTYSEGTTIPHTPAAAVAAGDVVIDGTMIGVAPSAIEANRLGAIQITGIYTVPKATGVAFTAGDDVYWDVADGNVNDDDQNNVRFGRIIADAASGATSVQVLLNP